MGISALSCGPEGAVGLALGAGCGRQTPLCLDSDSDILGPAGWCLDSVWL